jgi:CheY-like chemotaxis protein
VDAPNVPIAPEVAPPELAEEDPELQQKVRVLVVDDNVDFVTMLAAILRHKGFHVRTANTGPDGVAIATRWLPEVLLLDIGLPGLDGYEVARRIRADPTLAASPGGPVRMKLIALTGYGQESDVALAMDAGFDHHMVKPCDLEELQRLMGASAKQ